MGADPETMGEGFQSLLDGIINLNWPTEFFRKCLGMGESVVLRNLPVLLTAYLVIYLIALASCLTLRRFQKKTSIFGWQETILNLVLTLMPFVTFRLLVGTLQEMTEAAAAAEGKLAFSLEGLRYIGNFLAGIGWWRFLLVALFLFTLYCPLAQTWKCLSAYEPVTIGALWMVFDLGLGLACMACLLLGMYCKTYALYLLIPVLVVLNRLGRKRSGRSKRKKTAKK